MSAFGRPQVADAFVDYMYTGAQNTSNDETHLHATGAFTTLELSPAGMVPYEIETETLAVGANAAGASAIGPGARATVGSASSCWAPGRTRSGSSPS